MKLSSLCVTADDMDRAVRFYKKLFTKEPSIHEDRFSSFDLDGFGFDIFAPAVDKEDRTVGNNVIPIFYVDDLNAEKNRIMALGCKIFLEQRVNGYNLFQFTDSEGNILEVYTKNN